MNHESSKSFTDLKVWQEAHKIVLEIYKITKTFPQEEIYGLTSQMRRASISVSSNIFEGFTRWSNKEKVQFYYLSKSSLAELKNQIIISKDIDYLKNIDDYNKLLEMINFCSQLLQGLIRKTKEFNNVKAV